MKYEGMNRGSTNTGANVSVGGLKGMLNGRQTGPNNTPAGNVQTRAPMAPGGASVPFNNTPNLNRSVHGATVPLMAEYPSREPAEVGPLNIDMMNTGPNASGMTPTQGTASKR